MSTKPLQTQSLLDLIDLFERSGQPIADGDGQRLRGVRGWKVLGRTSLTPKLLEQWTDCVGYAGSYGHRRAADARAHGAPNPLQVPAFRRLDACREP